MEDVNGTSASGTRNTTGNITAYYLCNAHGDVEELLDAASGTTLASYTYDAFGTQLKAEETDTFKNTVTYRGYEFDSDTGLYYLNARYYDSGTARFLTEDTYRGEKDDPLSLNLYGYCAGNPMKYTDPSGHALTIAASIVVAVAVAVAGGAALIYYFATDGPEKLLDVLKRDKPTEKGSNLPSTGGGGSHKNDFIYYLLMAMSDPAFRNSPGAAIINAAGKSAFNDFCEWTEEVTDYIDYTWRYCVNGEEMIVPVKGDVSVTLKFDRDMTMYVDGHVVEDNLVDGKTPLNEYLENKVALYEKNEGSLNSNLAQYGDDFGKMGQYVENPNIKVDWSQYAAHGAERMKQRGMTQEMIENIIENGKVLSQSGGNKFAYITREGVAVVSKEGKLITGWTNANFDEAMINIVSKLFGE